MKNAYLPYEVSTVIVTVGHGKRNVSVLLSPHCNRMSTC